MSAKRDLKALDINRELGGHSSRPRQMALYAPQTAQGRRGAKSDLSRGEESQTEGACLQGKPSDHPHLHQMRKRMSLPNPTVQSQATRQRDLHDFHITRAMRGAECSTDHHLLRSKVNLQVRNKRRPQGGHRPRGRPKLRYKDTLKKSLQKCDIDEEQWEFLATNRSEWRQAIRKRTEVYENERQVSQVEKRAATKVRLNLAERSIKCPLCSRLCASDFA
ncbi:hypothetical protein ACOMHN_022946 [Nucella lapillus]